MRWGRGISFLVKFLLSLGILIYLFAKISPTSFWNAFLAARHHLIILAFFLYLVGQTLSAYKWRLLAQVLGFTRTFSRFLSFYFIGMFFNLFFLGSIGGDVGKAYLLAGKKDSRMRAAYSILADRFTGGMALVTIAVVFLVFSPTIHVLPLVFKVMEGMGVNLGGIVANRPIISLWLRIGLLLFCAAMWGFVLTMPFFLSLFPWLFRWAAKVKLGDFTIFWSYPRRMVIAFAISFCFQFINILVYALIGMGLGLGVHLTDYFVIVPLVDVVSILPISISGIGVREGAYVGLLYLFGIEIPLGLAFGVMGFVVVTCASLIGGVVYLTGDYPIKLLRRRSGA